MGRTELGEVMNYECVMKGEELQMSNYESFSCIKSLKLNQIFEVGHTEQTKNYT